VNVIVVVVGALLLIAAVLWFLLGRSPEETATHEDEPLPPERRAGRDLAGPADAGAEDMA